MFRRKAPTRDELIRSHQLCDELFARLSAPVTDTIGDKVDQLVLRAAYDIASAHLKEGVARRAVDHLPRWLAFVRAIDRRVFRGTKRN